MGKYIAHSIHGDSPQFELLADIAHKPLVGGRHLRVPAVLGFRFMTNTLDMFERGIRRSAN